eukprot:COSAG02_NODE_30591_length_548_cov_1.220490_1_plen_170_part_01
MVGKWCTQWHALRAVASSRSRGRRCSSGAWGAVRMAVAMARRRVIGGRSAVGQLALMRRSNGQQLRRLSLDAGGLPQSAVRHGACAALRFCCSGRGHLRRRRRGMCSCIPLDPPRRHQRSRHQHTHAAHSDLCIQHGVLPRLLAHVRSLPASEPACIAEVMSLKMCACAC